MRERGFYGSLILEQAPRVLSLMDRDALSPTAGCCDRTYWAWKFVDYPGARFQEALCAMSFLYATELPGSAFFRNPRLLEWIELGLRFWCSVQYADGSFDEAYPYERSLAATAFTTFYVGEALNFLGDACPPETREQVRRSMSRAGEWLMANDERHGFLSNHLAAAAAALYHVYRVIGEERFRARSRHFIDKIVAHQSAEGWYEEYGGADPGYQTHGSFYLARYCEMSGDAGLAESLARSMRFLAVFVHPDGSIGGEYASRNTQTYYPAAFEMFAGRCGAAAWIAGKMRDSVRTAAAAGLRSVDIYNYFPFLNNVVFAYVACGRPAVPPEEPQRAEPLVWFPKAGMARIRKPGYDAYVGTAKGGVVKVFAGGKRIYSDCGFIGRLKNGRLFSSQAFDPGRTTGVAADRIAVEGAFYVIPRPMMKPARFMAFRLFTLTANRVPSFARWLKSLLVHALIYRRKALDIRFRRTIDFGDHAITVRDEIAGPDGARAASLQRGEVFTTIHMGSSQYFIPNELEPRLGEPEERIDVAQITAGVKLTRAVAIPESSLPEDRVQCAGFADS
jgi:hypothetical protein